MRDAMATSDIQPSTKKCPFCAEEIKPEAIVCRFCGNDLDGMKKAATTKSLNNSTNEAKTGFQWSTFFQFGFTILAATRLMAMLGQIYIAIKFQSSGFHEFSSIDVIELIGPIVTAPIGVAISLSLRKHKKPLLLTILCFATILSLSFFVFDTQYERYILWEDGFEGLTNIFAWLSTASGIHGAPITWLIPRFTWTPAAFVSDPLYIHVAWVEWILLLSFYTLAFVKQPPLIKNITDNTARIDTERLPLNIENKKNKNINNYSWMAFALVVVVLVGSGAWYVKTKRDEATLARAQAEEADAIAIQTQLLQSNKIEATRKSINELIQQADRVATEMEKVQKNKLAIGSFDNPNDSGLIVVGKSGQFTTAGQENANIDGKLELLRSELINYVDNIQKVALEGGLPQEEVRPRLQKFDRYIKNTAVSDMKDYRDYPEPTAADIGILCEYAKQLKSAIQSAPKQVPNGNNTYNSIAARATAAGVGPYATQFDRQSRRFAEMYGQNNLAKIAFENGFDDLIEF